MNSIILKGRLCKDIEVRYTTGENSIAVGRTSIAIDRKGKDNETDFINVVAFGKTAEFIEKYFSKGQEILIAGRIQVNPYEDKEGHKRTSTDVVIEQVEFCGSKRQAVEQATEVDNDFQDDLPF